MLTYCYKCRKNTESKNLRFAKINRGTPVFLSKCAVCDSKKSTFIKELEANGVLSSLEIKTLLRQVPLVGTLLF